MAKFNQILTTPSICKKVQNQTINIMFLLILLDLNVLFNYVTPQDNHYYLEACKHHEFYTQLIITFAQYHAYNKLKAYCSDNEVSALNTDSAAEMD